MATHSSILAYGKIPWTEEPGRLQSIGSQRFRHNLATENKHKHTSYTLACLPSAFRIKIKISLMESPGPAKFVPYLPPVKVLTTQNAIQALKEAMFLLASGPLHILFSLSGMIHLLPTRPK